DQVEAVARLPAGHARLLREIEERRGDAEGGELRRGRLELRHARVVDVRAAGEGELAEVGQFPDVARREIDAARAGVDRVGEITAAADRGQAARDEEVRHRRAGVIAREHDAIGDGDFVRVDAAGELRQRLPGEAGAVVARLLRL